MSNKKWMKLAGVWGVTLMLACGLWVVTGKSLQQQNSNQNSNTTQNDNANKAGNRNTGATGEQTGMATMNSRDRDFLMDAAMGGMMEVELGRMATQQGSSEAVKQFGQRMVDDHSKANTELLSLASTKGVTLPTALDDKHRAHVTKLSAMTGAEFDRAYAKMMVSDHKKDVSAFEKQSTHGADPDLKAFAAKTLPTLQEHLQMAQALDPNQNKNSNSNSRP